MHPSINIGQKVNNGQTIFFIQDNGIGLAAAASTIFKPFRRLHTVEEFEGMGVGLSIVKKIITRHGGKIWFDGIPKEGTTFSFTLS